MAQNYLGSNNMNLLEPCGQFGTRLMGGKDSASPRYIFTKLSKHSEKSNDSLGYVGIGFTVIAGICVIIFLVRTGIDLTRPTITSTNIEGVSQINPGIPL